MVKVKMEAMLEDNFDEKIEALGPEAAITKFHEILKALVADKNTIILSRFVDAVNIFGYGKLRTVIKEQLPAVIQQLWKEELNDEACQVAQCLCYVLLIEKSYFDQDDSNTIWEAIFTKKTKSMAIEQSPIMALLTILLCGTSDDHWTSQLLESYDFPLEQMQDEAVATEYSHFESIIRDHKEVLLHVNPSTAVFLIKGLLKYYHTTLELEEYELIIDEYRRNKQLSTRPDLLEALDDPQLKVDHMEIEDKPIFEKDRIKLKFLIDVADNSPSKLGDIIKVLPHERIVNFLSKLPLKIKDNEKSCGLIVKYLLKKIREEDYELVRDVLMDIAELNSLPPSILSLCAEFVKVAGGKPIERDVVTLSLSMATTYDQKEFDAEAVMAMESLLHKCIFHAHCSITNDRVALYSQLLIHYIHALQRVLDDKETDETIKENMKYHCAQICYAITQHKLYFTRTVSFIISEILHSPMLGTYRLHEIADRPARALLAVALPPAPKRRYSKLLPIMKNARRFVA